MALCGLVAGIGLSQTIQPTTAQLEAFENYLKQSTAQITWSKEVGRIDTDRAHAVITAIVVEDAAQTPQQMRGVRIDLQDGNLKDQVYAGENLLGRLIQALDEITTGLPRFKATARSQSCFGSGIFWQQSGHAFSASHCVFGTWEGLSVSTGADTFRFTGIVPGLFAGAIARGRDELLKQGLRP
jgi:hypothetical protein